jgi:hypothetical protein
MLQDLSKCPDEESREFFIESRKQIMARLKNPASSTSNRPNQSVASQSQSQDRGPSTSEDGSSRYLPTSEANSTQPGTSEGVDADSSSEEEEDGRHLSDLDNSQYVDPTLSSIFLCLSSSLIFN